MREKLTIQDIARLAGVSKATVSRVLNHNPAVRVETSARVMRVMREHDFVPNITATGLAGGKTRLVGVLAPPLNRAGVPEILRGVAEYIEDTLYEMVLHSVNVERRHSDVLDRILSMRMISGLLAILPGDLFRQLRASRHQGLPLVLIDEQEKPTDIPWIGIDNMAGAYQAIRYLLGLGHRRIAYIQGPQHYACAFERYCGYVQALQETGITPDPTLVLQGRFDTASGRECATVLFSRERSTWPSAIFASNDQMAYGVLEVAEQRGVRVPEDIALVGFDDAIPSAHVKPSLTTVRQPFSQMGYTAIEQLLMMVDPNHRVVGGSHHEESTLLAGYSVSGGREQSPHILLPTRLIVRTSSGAPLAVPPGQT